MRMKGYIFVYSASIFFLLNSWKVERKLLGTGIIIKHQRTKMIELICFKIHDCRQMPDAGR